MIKLDRYTKEFEEEYWEVVNAKIPSAVQQVIEKSWEQFFPPQYCEGEDKLSFKEFILADFSILKEIQEYIKKNTKIHMDKVCFNVEAGKRKSAYPYSKLLSAYKDVADRCVEEERIRVKIIKNSGLTVCPYCNRNYINGRGKKVSGGELDHFFSKSKYPVFSLCLYNLVPSCGTCNRNKGSIDKEFVSPFDSSVNWEEEITFSYKFTTLDSLKVILNSSDKFNNNIRELKIREAYKIHDIEVKELLDKMQVYSISQMEEFSKVLWDMNLTDLDIKYAVFGAEVTHENMKTKPLGKMYRDLHKKLGIY